MKARPWDFETMVRSSNLFTAGIITERMVNSINRFWTTRRGTSRTRSPASGHSKPACGPAQQRLVEGLSRRSISLIPPCKTSVADSVHPTPAGPHALPLLVLVGVHQGLPRSKRERTADESHLRCLEERYETQKPTG